MCTMTWWQSAESAENFSVFFNRDESKARLIAEPPAEFLTEGGTRFLMPTDPNAGGTWMFVNEHGVVVTLLNWYDKAVSYHERESRFRSRGLLVKGLADIRDLAELEAQLIPCVENAAYRPFHLLGVAPNSTPRGWSWDGKLISTIQPYPFDESTLLDRKNGDFEIPLISSSSFQTEQVLRSRRERFMALNPISQADFEAFQTNSGELATAFTPRMNRPDAQTWSRSRVDVSRDGIVFAYVAELADLSGEGVAFESYLGRS